MSNDGRGAARSCGGGRPRAIGAVIGIAEGGEVLDDDVWRAPCPECGEDAEHGIFEQASCSTNIYHTVVCDRCGHRQGFDWLNP